LSPKSAGASEDWSIFRKKGDISRVVQYQQSAWLLMKTLAEVFAVFK
jgi:hypothetical protein